MQDDRKLDFSQAIVKYLVFLLFFSSSFSLFFLTHISSNGIIQDLSDYEAIEKQKGNNWFSLAVRLHAYNFPDRNLLRNVRNTSSKHSHY